MPGTRKLTHKQSAHNPRNQPTRKHLNKWPYAQVDITGRVELSPVLVIKYIARTNNYPKSGDKNTVIQHIAMLRSEIEKNNSKMKAYKKYKKMYDKYPVITEDLLINLLMSAQNNKKYLSRPSPSFPAKLFAGLFLYGRDGREYMSAYTGGSWKWASFYSLKSP